MNNKTFFSFVIPIINTTSNFIEDYNEVEAVLEQTIISLNKQKYKDFIIIVVSHKIPPWSYKYSNIVFLNVAGIQCFEEINDIYKQKVRIDKGIKHVIGAMYAIKNYNPELIMFMDGDDYVNINLIEYLKYFPFIIQDIHENIDGYVNTIGVHVNLEIHEDYSLRYINSYLVKGFHGTCGSCRILKSFILLNKLEQQINDIEMHFEYWPSITMENALNVPYEPVQWLWEKTKETSENLNSIINILGRHVKQNNYFNFYSLPIIGSAKGCGHNNHIGPKGAKITKDKIISPYPIERFYENFGISPG